MRNLASVGADEGLCDPPTLGLEAIGLKSVKLSESHSLLLNGRGAGQDSGHNAKLVKLLICSKTDYFTLSA
jgi:hypothetical protein